MLRIILSHVFLPWCGGRANRCVQSWRCAEQTLCWCHTSSCHIPQTRWTSRPPSQFQRQSDSQSGTRAHSAHVSLSFWLCLNHEKVQSISLAANNPQDDEHKNAQHSFVHSQLKEVDVCRMIWILYSIPNTHPVPHHELLMNTWYCCVPMLWQSVYLRGTAMANFSGSMDRSLRRSSSWPLFVGPIRAMGRFRLAGWW